MQMSEIEMKTWKSTQNYMQNEVKIWISNLRPNIESLIVNSENTE